jgi:SAM-dependent methyltransferase
MSNVSLVTPLEPTSDERDSFQGWNGDGTTCWMEFRERVDTLFEPLTSEALRFAAPNTGDRILDIGCGCGSSALELASRVGQTGHVLAVDLSRTILVRAKERLTRSGFQNVTFVLGDVESLYYEPASFEFLFSRFGVMFFRSPVDAFARLRRALRPAHRLMFVCWRPITENELFLVPLMAASPHLPSLRPPTQRDGGSGFRNPDYIRKIIESSGFKDITLRRHDTLLRLAAPGKVAEAAALMGFGVAARALADAKSSQRQAALSAIADTLCRYDSAKGVMISCAVWLVSAVA